MNDLIAIENIDAVLAREILIPTIVMWNRLEGRPRKDNFQRALRCEVRDPLWMLCKQWQVGEFKGDDAGSPIFAKAHMRTTKITRFQPGTADARPFDTEMPFETTVEERPISFFGQEHILSLDVRLLMGRQWTKLLGSAGLASLAPLFVEHYFIAEPDPNQRSDAFITAHAEVWQSAAALAGRAMDGAKLYFHLKENAANHAFDGVAVADGDKPAIDLLAERFVAWYENLFQQPVEGNNDAWLGKQLEYQFAVSAPEAGGDKVMVAEEYYHGRLDWYNLDVDPSQSSLPGPPSGGPPADVQDAFTYSFLPVTIQFEGMPNTRWWTFEDSKTSFGDIEPDTTDVSKLLLMEFGLVYANDWFLVPFQLPVGSLANVAGLAVTNVFGERTWVRAAGSGADKAWQRWAMYNMKLKGNADVAADTTLVLLPTVPKCNEGQPIDDVQLIRDEVANMVWAVEQHVPLATGRSKSGHEAGTELAKRYESILDHEIDGGIVEPDIPEHAAAIRYELMQGVPENWIPMIPVHKDGDNREIQLQRASMPRIIVGDPNPPEKIKPRTTLMRQGLDETPAQPYYLYEEEVPRAGVRVTQSFQRTRWHDGRVFTWIGARKSTGRGEGNSGLAFDRVKPTQRQLRRALRNDDG
jgi:hypothetical protein